jgi:hypothetical protein
VLGVSYNELGIGIAKTWNFPPRLIAGMQKFKADKIFVTKGDAGRLSVNVNMANELCAIATVSDPEGKKDALEKIRLRYADVVEFTEEQLSSCLEKGLKDMSLRAEVLGIDTSKSLPLKKLRKWLDHADSGKLSEKQNQQKAAAKTTGEPTLDLSIDAKTLVNVVLEDKVDPEAVLSNGIQDVTNTLVGEYKLNDVLQMVLETIYRSLGFRNVLIFSRDLKQGKMIARFGFGQGVAGLIPQFRFPLAFEADVFHLALEKGLDIVIEDVGAPNIANKIPLWYEKAIDSRYFLLLPIQVNKVAVGMIYADMLEAKKLQLTSKQLSMLRTLRNQAVLAIKQKT